MNSSYPLSISNRFGYTFVECLVKLKVMLSVGFSLSKILFSKSFLNTISKSHGSLHPAVGAGRIVAEKVFLILAPSSRACYMDMVTYRLLTKGFTSLASFLRSISRYTKWLMSVVVMIPSMRTCSSVRWLICEMSSNNLLFDSLESLSR